MRIFISMPMNNRTDEEIKTLFERYAGMLRAKYPGSVIIDSVIKDHSKRNDVANLSQSIEFLSRADLAYFAPGWQHARGCKIENIICKSYGIETTEGAG